MEFLEIAKVFNMKILVLRNSKVSVQALPFSIQRTSPSRACHHESLSLSCLWEREKE